MSRSGAIVVVEPAPRWVVLLRRFAPQLEVLEARSLELAEDLLRENGSRFIAIAVRSVGAAAIATRISHWRRTHPGSVAAVLLNRHHPSMELGFRLAGAQAVIHNWRELPILIGMAARHCRLHAESAAIRP